MTFSMDMSRVVQPIDGGGRALRWVVVMGICLIGHIASAQILEASDTMTVVGTRLTKGNAVDCPQIRTDDGTVVAVFHLSPQIALGQRIQVTGRMVYPTTCHGPALGAESVVLLE